MIDGPSFQSLEPQRYKNLGIKWILFAFEMLFLFATCGGLFFDPDPYIGARGIIILTTALLALVAAWASGSMFKSEEDTDFSVWMKPPVLIFICVFSSAAVVMICTVLSMLGRR